MRAAFAAVLLLCTAVATVHAVSSGMLGFCNLDSRYKYGGAITDPISNRVTRGPSTNIMNWVESPTQTLYYTIRSGDSSTLSDPTYYTPDEWTSIHIRTHDLDRKFIGLVLYAINGTSDDVQVGQWKITEGSAFIIPETCKGTAVTHADADLKPLHNRFFFKAPKGTGTAAHTLS